jgi:radical SAM superfamily enzyme YgiQ (UPF0313 family)
MSDILMIFPRPSATSPQKNPAISIFYPGESAVQQGFMVDYWDERFDDLADLHKKAKQSRVFGISSLSGFMLGRTIEILKWCKAKYPDKPTILGGVHATFLSENSLQESFVDYVVLGEGEERLPTLLRVIYSGNGLDKIDGVGYKQDNRLIINPRKRVIDLSANYVSPVSERTEKYFQIAAQRNEVILPSSRGCPWANYQKACSFCSVQNQYLGTYRVIPFEKWAEDIDKIYRLHPFSQIELEDENSAYFVRHLEKYAAHLQRKGIKYHLHLRADQLQNEEVVRRLAETGCLRIHTGVESGNDRIRNEVYKKREKIEYFYRAATLLAKYGVEGVYTYMIGAPTETKKEIFQTLRLSDKISHLHQKGKSRSTIYVLMALPGTEIFDRSKKGDWLIPQTTEEWSKVSAASNPTLPAEINNIYFIAGLHHNRFHKTAQNFPRQWRLLIVLFEVLCELRWKLKFFKYFALEKFLIEKLITWRSKKSIGKN